MTPDRSTRRTHGVVYTPQSVADEIARICSALPGRVASILEPSCGDGVFLRSSQCRFTSAAVTGVDIDGVALNAARQNLPAANYVQSDFLSFAQEAADVRFDLVIGNPPYVRKHNFSATVKLGVEALSVRSEYPITHLKNAWVAFVVAAVGMLSPKGTLAFVVPYELITVNYAEFLRGWLAARFKQIDIYVPEEKAFKSIDQDAVVLVATNAVPDKVGVNFHKVSSLDNLNKDATRCKAASVSTNMESISFILDANERDFLAKVYADLNKVGDYCDSSAGTVTAANDFFILRKEDVFRFGLEDWARPILKKGAYVKSLPIFSSDDFQSLEMSDPCYLIDFCASDGKPLDGHAYAYISMGEDLGIDKRYKSLHRRPWYKIPVVRQAPGLFFKRSHKLPKLCMNKAGVLSTDTAYHVYPKLGYTMENICFSFYNSLTLLFCEIEGRFYGGGVLELTPKEFRRLPLVYSSASVAKNEAFLAAFNDQSRILDLGDEWLRESKIFDADDLSLFRSILVKMQTHRLRHGA